MTDPDPGLGAFGERHRGTHLGGDRRGDLVVTETRHGFVCANSGVDLSNMAEGYAALLPVDPDRSARRIRDGLRARSGCDVGVIVSDTFGRAWRRGVTDVAIGSAVVATEICVVDEIAGAAELVMGKAAGVPVAIVRGLDASVFGPGSVREDIVRPYDEDLFR